MSWGMYEIGRSNGYEEGRASTQRPHVVVDRTAVYAAAMQADWAGARVDAYRRVIASHPDRARIESQVALFWPRYYGWRRFRRYIGVIVKLTGWLIALNLIGSKVFGY